MRGLAFVISIVLAGCSSDLYLRSPDAAAGGAVPGQSGIGGSVEVRSASSAAASLLFTLGLLSIAVSSSGDAPLAPYYPLDPMRRIHEQDCTQPIKIASGNLRCR